MVIQNIIHGDKDLKEWEILLVVFGNLIALQVNNWNNYRDIKKNEILLP